jgi:hypothetical protein
MMSLSTLFIISLVTLYHPYFWHFPAIKFIYFVHLHFFTLAELQYLNVQNIFVFYI